MSNIIPIDFSQVPAFAKGKSSLAQALDDTLSVLVRRHRRRAPNQDPG